MPPLSVVGFATPLSCRPLPSSPVAPDTGPNALGTSSTSGTMSSSNGVTERRLRLRVPPTRCIRFPINGCGFAQSRGNPRVSGVSVPQEMERGSPATPRKPCGRRSHPIN
jgi:hypothetical protein